MMIQFQTISGNTITISLDDIFIMKGVFQDHYVHIKFSSLYYAISSETFIKLAELFNAKKTVIKI